MPLSAHCHRYDARPTCENCWNLNQWQHTRVKKRLGS
ncbi:Uncharacterised protein [Vibrio cholerae]|nr:Uncharacterised protein [Vibrio cholerae]CSI65618.1 Uncharacterised protein [Vibrio cholerae]